MLVALCYFETFLSWHMKELSKTSRRKVTEPPEKPASEECSNFSLRRLEIINLGQNKRKTKIAFRSWLPGTQIS